jgi:RNA polymerase sigma-70 factor (ECF subfamily)
MIPESFRTYTDEQLASALLESGNDLFFEALYARYFRKVLHQCYAYVKDRDLAEDLAQDTFVKVRAQIGKFGHRSSFSTWIFVVSRNVCLDYLKKERKYGEREDETAASGLFEFDEELSHLKEEQLQRILELIPLSDREILWMKYANDWQIEEIMEVTGLRASAVKMRLKRAKSRVKALYEKYFQEG